MEIVQRGSRGIAARMAQMLLNDRNRELPDDRGLVPADLAEDGAFGPKSERALVHFLQRGLRVSRAPVIDPFVWNALGLRVDIDHRLPLVAQPVGGQCWSAAAAMILGGPMSVHPGLAKFDRRGALDPSPANLRIFGESLGWRSVPTTTDAAVFASALRQRPMWVAGQGQAANGRRLGHAVVVSGMWGDGRPDGSTALLRFHDPWPPGHGRIYAVRFFSVAGTQLPGGIWFRPDVFLSPA